MIKVGVDVELLMKKTIVQAKLNKKGRYGEFPESIFLAIISKTFIYAQQ